LKEETEYHVDPIGLCKATVHVVDWGWDISLSSPQVLFGSDNPYAGAVA